MTWSLVKHRDNFTLLYFTLHYATLHLNYVPDKATIDTVVKFQWRVTLLINLICFNTGGNHYIVHAVSEGCNLL